jgi:hypothetical protein
MILLLQLKEYFCPRLALIWQEKISPTLLSLQEVSFYLQHPFIRCIPSASSLMAPTPFWEVGIILLLIHKKFMFTPIFLIKVKIIKIKINDFNTTLIQ